MDRNPRCLEELLDRLRPRIILRLRRYAERVGAPEAFRPEEQAQEFLGSMWLELAASDAPEREWGAALRRVLYREWEKPHRQRSHSLPVNHPAPDPARPAELPSRLKPWALQFLAAPSAGGHPALAALDMGLTRGELRLRVTALVRGLTDGDFFPDLRRRAARLLVRAAQDGPRAENRLEARSLLRILSMVEVPPDLSGLSETLRTLAARRSGVRAESPTPASGCEAPRARGTGR